MCTRPSEMVEAPDGLTGCSAIDDLKRQSIASTSLARGDKNPCVFFEEFEQEMDTEARHDMALSKIMQDMWESQGTSFWRCLSSVNVMHRLLECHLLSADILLVKAEMILPRP